MRLHEPVQQMLHDLWIQNKVSDNHCLLSSRQSALNVKSKETLMCDYYNWAHLDKVGQSDYKKYSNTVHAEKVSWQSWLLGDEINNMGRNQPITTYRRDLLNPLKQSPCFLRGLLEYWQRPSTNFLGMYCYFSVIWLVSFDEVAVVIVVTL